ncbi:hypothetical protein [Stutzerimonas xanthomarina]|uniref:hypothetical protein n=1 Tax=Stutzerimonas xanthomarina TaxID=271420 RepID=UPI003AA80BE9
MGIHSPKDVEGLIAELQERHDKLVAVMRGKETTMMAIGGEKSGRHVKAEAIHFATDDVATALKRIKARLGKD